MKKQKALEDMTHKDLFEGLIYDENIQDNMHVSNDYAEDKYGNTVITMGFEGTGGRKNFPANAIMLFSFNKRGRLVSVEVAMRKKGDQFWYIASSERFVDMKARFGSDELLDSATERKTNGN